MGNGVTAANDLNWEELGLEAPDLSNLADPISMDEVCEVVNQMPVNKAPRPDGFTGLFFRQCWDTIKEDIMSAISMFCNLHSTYLRWLNLANVVLLPKKDGAEEISDYHPISLINVIAKLIAKILAIRLSSHMQHLVSNTESVFIKTRSIHDNIMYERNLATWLH